MMPQKDWSIWLVEKPVLENAKRDAEHYGRPFSHPFLVLKDCSDVTQAEIHGSWCKWPRKESIIVRASKLFEHFTAATCSNRSAYMLSKASGPLYPVVKISFREGNFHGLEDMTKQQVYAGAKTNAMERWAALAEILPDMNAHRLPFFRYAQRGSGVANCQVILRATIEKADAIDAIPELHLAQTGWTPPVKTAIHHSL